MDCLLFETKSILTEVLITQSYFLTPDWSVPELVTFIEPDSPKMKSTVGQPLPRWVWTAKVHLYMNIFQ